MQLKGSPKEEMHRAGYREGGGVLSGHVIFTALWCVHQPERTPEP